MVMWLPFIFLCIFIVTFTNSTNIGSYEINPIELTPLHDAIIFNDIAGIVNDLENSMNPELNKHIFSDSESTEDIEELLSEYQHYLDKAHKQRVDYIEKVKGKNKIPLTRREKYTKINQSGRRNNNDLYDDYFSNKKYSKSSFPESLNLFMSHNSKVSMDNKPEFTTFLTGSQVYKEESPNIFVQKNNEKALQNFFPTILKANEPISSCYCKVNQIPCQCSCKQCFTVIDSLPNRNLNNKNENIFIDPKISKYTSHNKLNNVMDDKLNLRIKIDLQLPKLYELGAIHKYYNHERTALENETISTVNLPFPNINFPIPIELLGYKKIYNKHDPFSTHKITLHKKKKSRLCNKNKKYIGKKVITFHTIKLDRSIEPNNTEENDKTKSISKNNSIDFYNKGIEEPKFQTNELQDTANYTNNNTETNNPLKHTNGSIETRYLTGNISKKKGNYTNESSKIENSIETDFVDKDNKTTIDPLRLKREALERNIKIVAQSNTTVVSVKHNQSLENHTNEIKKFNKTLEEMELLYWPTEIKNITLVSSKNITALILERETKKAKLNMTHDKIRSNRTKALEQAIFGDVDWNDVDTIAPALISFVGKYIRGSLTFCSQSICHSMKCAEKICLHRICTPINRFNHKGHCAGNNDTDSVAAMESIMDLPSNIVFEIVDILQDKMLGKMYGKATLCIISKCSTFIASKKFFQKSKCTYKELSSTGHCQNYLSVS